LQTEKEQVYDANKSDEAKYTLNNKNWSGLFPLYLERIDLSPGGTFDETWKDELTSITQEMLLKYPNECVERLITQYASILANWR